MKNNVNIYSLSDQKLKDVIELKDQVKQMYVLQDHVFIVTNESVDVYTHHGDFVLQYRVK